MVIHGYKLIVLHKNKGVINISLLNVHYFIQCLLFIQDIYICQHFVHDVKNKV